LQAAEWKHSTVPTNDANGGHWALASFRVAWEMQVTDSKTNRLFGDNEISW